MKTKELKAFTLAETLITLAVIGIVAAISIPSFMQNVENQKFKTAAKTAYATIASAVNQMKADEGGSLSSYYDANIAFKPVFVNYFKILKDCGGSACVAGSYASDVYSTINGNPASTNWGAEGQFVTADGMFFNIQNSGGSGYPAIDIIVDVNGYIKGPNKYGVDTFAFYIYNDKLLPEGAPGTYMDSQCDRNSSNYYAGLGCTVKVIKDEAY